MGVIFELLLALGLTIFIEYIVIQAIFEDGFVLPQVVLVNVLTNPLVNIFYRFLINVIWIEEMKVYLIISIAEIIVFIIEAFLYKKILNITTKRALLCSFTANLMAYIASFLI